MLAAHGELGEFGESLQVTFEETAGPVPITIRRRPDGRFWCELAAPEALSLGATVPVPAPKMRHVTGRVQHHELDIAGNLVHWWHTKQKSE